MPGIQRATIGLERTTKARLDKNRAPGQCCGGFTCQIVDLWEKAREENSGKDDLIREVMLIRL